VSSAEPVIDRFAEGGPLLAYALSGLAPGHEKARPGPGSWSIAELAAHLVDADLVIGDRMKRVIAEEQPVLLAFDENAWLDRLDSQSMPVDEVAVLFAAHRRWMARVLRNCTEADFARAGMHSEAGRKTLADLLAGAVGHLDHHLRFLYGKRANLGVALPPRYSFT
jgi:uncharacterized damage-inducible protein DinB